MHVTAILVLFLGMTLCGATKNEDDEEKIEGKFQKSLRIFSALLFSQQAQAANANENIFFSPASISHVLGMLNSGARGNTSMQIKKVLHVKNTNAEVDDLMKLTTEGILKPRRDSTTMLAARGFHAPGYAIKHSYIESLENNYHSEIEEMNFMLPAVAAKRINTWVEDHTNKLITELVSPDMFTDSTRLVLVNALYFKAIWEQGFKMTSQPKVFHAPTGDLNIPFMSGVFYYRMHMTKDTVQIAIPYLDGKTKLVIVMPISEAAMSTFMQKNNLKVYLKNLKKDMKSWIQQTRKLIMPPFNIEKSMNVKEILNLMGVQDIFNPEEANLSGMSEEMVFVSDFVHKAKIIVDRNGTEAAAGNAAIISSRSAVFQVPELLIDRPFVFTVLQEGNMLFMGRFSDPTA